MALKSKSHGALRAPMASHTHHRTCLRVPGFKIKIEKAQKLSHHFFPFAKYKTYLKRNVKTILTLGLGLTFRRIPFNIAEIHF